MIKLLSLLPSIVLFLGMISLVLSGLSLEKAITIQAELLSAFWQTLAVTDVMTASLAALGELVPVVLPILPFLVLVMAGIWLVVGLKEKLRKRLFWASLLAFLLAIHLLFESVFLLVVWIGVGLACVSALRCKAHLGACSKGLKIVNIFLTLSLFLALCLRFEAYEPIVMETNLNMLFTIISPEQIGGVVSGLTLGAVQELERSIAEEYEKLPSMVRERCRPVYDAVMTGMEVYEAEVKGLDVGEQVRRFVTGFPLVQQTTKATPLFLAAGLYALLEGMRFLLLACTWVVVAMARKLRP
jgi:hypothetical protein